ESSPFEVLVRAPSNCTLFTERPPVPSPRVDVHASDRRRHTKTDQAVDDVPLALPLLEQNRTQAASSMSVDAPEVGVLLLIADSEVGEPTAHVHVQPPDAVVERLSPVAWRSRFQLCPKTLQGVVGHEHVHFPALQAPELEAQKRALLWPRDLALLCVDLEPETLLDEGLQARHHTVPGSFA